MVGAKTASTQTDTPKSVRAAEWLGAQIAHIIAAVVVITALNMLCKLMGRTLTLSATFG